MRFFSTSILILALMFHVNHLFAQGWRNSHTLHYDRPAQFFEEALVIGNGTLGGILYGGPLENHISLNDITLWTGEPDHSQYDAQTHAQALAAVRHALAAEDYRAADSLQRSLQGHYSENYQPLGSLSIRYLQSDTTLSHYQRWLDISTATAGDSYHIGEATRSTDYFCSHPDQVMVVRIRSSKPFRCALSLHSQLPHHTSVSQGELYLDGYAAYHSLPHYTYRPQMFWYDSSRGIHFRTIIHPVGASSFSLAPDGSLLLSANREVLLLIANATSFNGFDKDPVAQGADYLSIVRQRIDQASAFTYPQLLQRHLSDYQSFFNRVKLDLGRTPNHIRRLPTDVQLRRYTDLTEHNPDLEELYFQFGRYLLISSSRTPGVPATLQGLWNEHILPPWSSNYTTNINLEENYWPAEVANLSEMHQPLLQFLQNLAANGRSTASQFYGVDTGWCLAHNTDIWAMTCPVGDQEGDPSWACWNMGGAWLSTHIWEHFLFSRDTVSLRQNYPILKSAAQFCLEWLQPHQDHLLTSPSTSPENKFLTPQGFAGATSYGGTADLAIIRDCLMDASLASYVLNLDEPFRAQVYEALTHMLPYHIGAQGNLQEWYHDWPDVDPHHRHQSHLFGLYPGHSLDPLDSDFNAGLPPTDLHNACLRTLQLRGSETTGWSTGWRINLYARLGNADMAYQTFRQLLRYISPDAYQGPDRVSGGGTYPNLLDAHSPFQIDGNFGGCAGVCEMLLQSSRQTVRLCPALPQQWRNVKVSGLRTRTGHTVSFRCRHGRPHRSRIQ